eukprot:TRINITY_DN11939_c1_g3_i3.p1 TRINITY_DN11939_c1_g3~~TRINITY_DN11939_c1_g3_i3.p1  ORF type:complete len:591 (+),score=108.95 TRINITY_DN11939_c1_g3_i3:65-1837(+)
MASKGIDGDLSSLTTLHEDDTDNEPIKPPMEQFEFDEGPLIRKDEQEGGSGMNKTLILAAVMAALGGFLFGYDIGIISGALLQLEEQYNLTDFQKEMVVSLMLVGAIIASITGGFIVDRIGRRDAIVINAGIFFIGAAILTASNGLGVLLLGRVIVGFAVSLSAVAEVIYISEIAPARHRGALVSLNEMGITVGILVSYTVNFAFIETPNGWRYMFGLSVLPALVQGVGMLYLPRSPRWLVMRHRAPEARSALLKLRSLDENAIVDEMKLIEDAVKTQQAIPISALITDKTLRKCLMIGCTIVLLQQFTGQPNVLYYGSTLFKAAGFKSDRDATLANLFIGLVKVIATAISLAKVDKLGRRALLLIGTVCMVISLIILASVTAANPPDNSVGTTAMPTTVVNSSSMLERTGRRWNASSTQLLGPAAFDSPWLVERVRRRGSHPAKDAEAENDVLFTSPAVKWTSLVCMLAFVVAYAFSYGPVSWLVLSEIFPDDLRGRAVSIATIFNWLGNLIVSVSFLSLMDGIGFSGTFFLYAAIGVLAFFFVLLIVPETKGKSLEEIQVLMSRSTLQLHHLPCYSHRRYDSTFESTA